MDLVQQHNIDNIIVWGYNFRKCIWQVMRRCAHIDIVLRRVADMALIFYRKIDAAHILLGKLYLVKVIREAQHIHICE